MVRGIGEGESWKVVMVKGDAIPWHDEDIRVLLTRLFPFSQQHCFLFYLVIEGALLLILL